MRIELLIAVAALAPKDDCGTSKSASKESRASNSGTNSAGDPAALPFASSELEGKLKKQIGDGNLFKRGSLEIRHWEVHEIGLTFHLNAGRVDADLPEVSAMGVAKLTIDDLIAAGFNPHDHWTMIHVWVEQPAGPSVTGTQQVRVFGEAKYDFSADKLTYDAEGD